MQIEKVIYGLKQSARDIDKFSTVVERYGL